MLMRSWGTSSSTKRLLVAFEMSQVEIDELDDEGLTRLAASIVTAKHFDFFKGEPVERVMPAVFDDGDLHKQDASVLKAFLNPSVRELARLPQSHRYADR